jgi:antitoxin MazE
MVKTLTRVGNSSALVVDKPIMELLEIDNDTPLKITVEGRRMIVEPAEGPERVTRFRSAMKKTGAKNAELFRRLAK